MESQSKQRIIGAIVMVLALAVFVFFLLRNPAVPTEQPVLKNMPNAQPQKVSTMSFELPAKVSAPIVPVPVVAVPATPVPAAAPVVAVQPAAATNLLPTPVAPPPKVVVTAPAPVPVAPPVPVSAPAPAPVPVSMPAPTPAPVAHKDAPALQALQMMTAPEAWVLQVGTFSSTSRANHLVTQLRAEGLDVYTRAATRSDGRESVRVFVGPKIHRADIDAIRARLDREFRLNGVIRKYQL